MISDMAEERKKELAERIISLSQKRIVEDAPALLMAVYALNPREKEEKEQISTDDTFFYYHPEQVIADFQKEKDAVAKQMLHVIIHCLLGHLQEREFYPDTDLFDAIADCKVAAFADAICKKMGMHWMWHIPGWLDCERKPLSQLYQELSGNKNNRKQLMKEWKKDLRVDDHELWQKKVLLLPVAEGKEGTGQNAEKAEMAPNWNKIRGLLFAKAEKTGQWGNLAGELVFQGGMAAENEISYEDFLRRFAVSREQMKEDPDSIDFKWYHLGLEQYGDIPLLEPTECNELPASDHIVIAVDTSGSCEGEVCSRFLRETLHLLRDISAGRKEMNVTLLQCDTIIQQELRVTSADQIDDTLQQFQPRGFGGTDFRPVFEWIEEYQKNGGKVKALLYLSDGEGDFPEKCPDYPVAFLLHAAWNTEEIPPWVLQLHLNTNDFTVREAR